MTLRSRLVLGAVLVAIVVLGGSWAVSVRQGSFVLAETDARLERLIPVARAAARRLDDRNKAPQALVSAVSDAWIGRMSLDGEITTLIAPPDDPMLVPDFSRADAGDEPSTHGTSTGRSETVRVLSRVQGNGQRLIVAIPMDDGAAMLSGIRRISLLLAGAVIGLLALMVWWVNRLGISPLSGMTVAARRIASGDTGHRVPSPSGNAEAAVLADALNSMVDELRMSDERIRQFVADASHELRTPLTTVRGYSDLYESGALHTEPQVADAMRRIRSEADRMNRIVSDLLELRGVEETPLALSPHRLDRIVAQCAADLRVANPLRRVTVDCVECTVNVDAARITQAVMALGTNAVEHTHADSDITMTVQTLPGTARIEVTDNGPGIAPEHLDRLFERLYRADQARTSGANSGIGLSVVAAIVRAHGGRYGVNSAPGKGAMFWVEIPLRGD
jgi:two-component system OmpR family sensor kinase